MSTLYESFNDTFDQLPVKIYRHDLSGRYIWSPLHWQRSTELLVSFEGHNQISIGHNNFVFTEDDWTIINSSEVHSSRYLSTDDTFKGISVIISLPYIETWIGENVFFYNPGGPAITKQIQETALSIHNLDSSDSLYSLMLTNDTMTLMLILAQ